MDSVTAGLALCPKAARASLSPRAGQLRHDSFNRELMTLLKCPLADAVVCACSLCVAVRAQRNAEVVGCIHAHSSLTTGVRGFAPPFDSAGDARHFANGQ